MTHNGAIETFEIERKYQVDGDAELPGTAAFADLGLLPDGSQRHELHARYFDTPEGALATQRIALRHRVGGKDEGWHLKSKGSDGARELLWPPQPEMPPGLRAELAHRIGADSVQAIRLIASLRTDRRTTMLRDAAGVAVVELADDRVDAVNELSGRRQTWREWEAELMPGVDAEVLDRVEPLLTGSGAARVRGTSKIERTMQGEGAES